MKPKTMLEYAEPMASPELLQEIYGAAGTPEERKAQVQRFAQTRQVLTELLTNRGGRTKDVPNISLKEAVHTADFKILFPKVIQGTLQQPAEPQFIGQGLLARTINVEGARIMEFPTLGAIRAFELGDTQEPPEQDPSFSKNITEIRVRRFGLKLEMTNDVIDESQWDVLGLYTTAAGNAMRRLKEELIFNEYETKAVNIFDNAIADPSKWTTGKASNGTSPNATFDHLDLLDMMAALGANGYNPTDVILHPLAWAIWAKDPTLRFQLLHRGAIGQQFGMPQGTDINQNANVYVPFGLNVVVSPFQTIQYNANIGTGSATGGAADYTTITVLDRNSSVLILQRTPMSISQWENPIRDIQNLMFHEKYGLAILNGGRSAVTAKHVRIDLNHNPVYSIRTVTSA